MTTRLLLVGAFAYPHHQGSQVYFQEQALALRAAGAEVELLTYGPIGSPTGEAGDPDRWRALDGFRHHVLPEARRPRSGASGPNARKPGADLALARLIDDAVASKTRRDAPFDAILAHNFEACVMTQWALRRRPGPGPASIYCVHTLMGQELSAYPKVLKAKNSSESESGIDRARRRLRRGVDRLGAGFDRRVARAVDGWIALTRASYSVMRQHSTAPGALIPPPLPDPRHRFFDPPRETVLARHGLEEQGFFLYSGNLDGYQELALLDAAAARLAAGPEPGLPLVVASFDSNVLSARTTTPGLRRVLVDSESDMQALVGGARATVVARRAEGGFPIKLANSLAQGTAPIAFLDREWGLERGIDMEWADARDPAAGLAAALLRLSQDRDRAARLGRGARARFEAAHRPEIAARGTLALVEEVRARRGQGGEAG